MSRATQFVKNLQHFRLITFDVTDTLLGFRFAPAIQYAKTAAEMGVTDIDQKSLEHCFQQEFKNMSKKHPNFGCKTPNMSWQQWWLELVTNIFHCVKPTISPEQVHFLAETLLRIYRTSECWTRIASGEEMVQKMRDAGKCVGVISNFDPSLQQVLRAMDMERKFDFVLTSYDVGVQKPHCKIFEVALECSKVQAHEALHIGNTYELDYVGARNSGWSSLLVGSNIAKANVLHEAHVYKSLADMLNALETKDIIFK